jgi:hypothetical protein
MRLLTSCLALSVLLAGCTTNGLPVIGGNPAEREGVVGTTSILGTVGKGASVIAAGGANVIAAGGANAAAGASAGVVAAGGANAVAPERAPVAAAPVISAGGGNLIATSSVQVIAAGGMNLQSPVTPQAPSGPGGPKSAAVAPGTVKGVVKGPGALIAQQDTAVPVGNVYVGLYDLTGQRVGEAVQANDKGEFALADVPAYKLLFLRTQFTYNGREYYLSTPFRLEGAEGKADLTPVSTVSEARFFTKAVTAPPDDAFGEAYLDAFWAATDGLHAKVPANALWASATIDDRGAAYDSLARLNAELFKNDIVAVFDKTWTTDPTGAAARTGTGGGATTLDEK